MSVRKYTGVRFETAQAAKVLFEAFEEDPLMLATFGNNVWKGDGETLITWIIWVYFCDDMIDIIVENDGTDDSNIVSVALWEGTHISLSSLYRILIYLFWLMYRYGFSYTWRLIIFFVSMLMKKEQVAPKAYHLSMIGTASKMQGKGIGSKILRHGVSRVSDLGLKCYLESSNPKNVPFYLRNGFRIVEEYYPLENDKETEGKGPVVTLMMN